MLLVVRTVCGLTGLISVSLQAQTAVGFRSGFTEGTGIPPRGAVELDYGSSVTSAGDTRTYAVGELTAHIPLAQRAGLRLHLNSYTWIASPGATATGREDLGIGSALTLRETRAWRPMVALLTRLDAPSGSLPNRAREWRPAARFALAWQLPAGVALASNIGVALPSDHGTRFTQRYGSVWLARSVSRRVGSFGEVVAFDRASRSTASIYVLRGGISVLVSDALHVDLHASTQHGGAGPRRTMGVGLKERF